MLLDIASWVAAFFVGEELIGMTAAYLVACCSAIFAVAVGACTILSMNEGMHGVISGVRNVSGSLVSLFIGALLKVPAVSGLPPREAKLSRVVVGGLGESFVSFPCFAATEAFEGATNNGWADL